MNGQESSAGLVRHPQMRAVLDYYLSIPRAGAVPAFRDFDPFRFKACMASMYVWECERAQRDFTLRLVGEEIRARFEGSHRGMRLEDAFSGEVAASVRERYLRCIEEPAIMLNSGAVYVRIGSHRRGERLCLPMADNQERVSLLLGLTLLECPEADGDRLEIDVPEDFEVQFCRMHPNRGPARI
jgi:hypothetical protein